MPYDDTRLKADLDYITSLPQWQDEKTRSTFAREVAVATHDDPDPEVRRKFVPALWQAAEGGAWKQAGDFVKTGVEEVVKSIPAAGGAAAFAITDAAGITSTGSPTRLRRGVVELGAGAVQRLKQLGSGEVVDADTPIIGGVGNFVATMVPGESKQKLLADTLKDLRTDLDKGVHPVGLTDWLRGAYDDGLQLPDEETAKWISYMTSGLGKMAVEADHMGEATPEKIRAWMETDRNPAWTQSETPGMEGPRELLADYLVTGDPASWQAFEARVRETDVQRTTRLRRMAAERTEFSGTVQKMPDGLLKDLTQRSADMQTSPIDLASSVLPPLRGSALLKAAKAGARGIVPQVIKGGLKEAAQEAGTEYLGNANASTSDVIKAGALGAVGSVAMEGTMAAAGRLMRPAGLEIPAAAVETINAAPPPEDSGLSGIAARAGRYDAPAESPSPQVSQPPTGLGPTGTVIPASGPTASVPPATQPGQIPAQTAGPGSLPASVSAAAPGTASPSANAPTPAGVPQLPSPGQVMSPTAPTAAAPGAALPGSLPATSQPSQSAAQAGPGSSAAAALRSPPSSPPTAPSQAAAAPQARPATESERARLRVAERVLTTQGVDQETAAVLAARLAESLPEGLPMEAMRERVLAEFAAAGGTLPGSVPRRYVEDANAYQAMGYNPQEAAMHAANAKTANDSDVQAAHEKNGQLREALNRPRVKMSKAAWIPKANTTVFAEASRPLANRPKNLSGMDGGGIGNGWDYQLNMSGNAAAALGSGRLMEPDFRAWLANFLGLPPSAITKKVLFHANANAQNIFREYHHVGSKKAIVEFYDPEQIIRAPKFFLGMASELSRPAHKTIARKAALEAWQTVKSELIESGDLGVWSFAEETTNKGGVLDKLDPKYKNLVGSKQMTLQDAVIADMQSILSRQESRRAHLVGQNAKTLQELEERLAAGLGNSRTERQIQDAKNRIENVNAQIETETAKLLQDHPATKMAAPVSQNGQVESSAKLENADAPTRAGDVRMTDRATEATSDSASKLKQSRSLASGIFPRQVTREQAQGAMRYVQQAAPELVKNVALVGSRAELDAQHYHPDDWADMESSEGFFDPRTGQIIVFLDQVSVREGELPRRAVMRVIVHETIGHRGLEALRQTNNPAFAKRWNALIEQIENDPALSAEIAAIGEQPGYEHLAEDPDGLVEEWFARQIEGMSEAELNAVPATSTLGKLLQWLKDALAYVAQGFSRKTWTAREIREIAALSRQALKDGGPQGVSDGRVKQSRKFNPLHGSDLPNWLRRPLGMPGNAPFRVQALGLRALLKGSALPAELLPFARRSERDIAALRQSAAQIGQDLNTAVDAYAKRSGVTLEAAHVLVAKAMETPALLASLPDPVLKERIRRARNLLDDLSATTAKYAGGDLGAAILKNRGHWMRRAYACFDEASNWNFDNLEAAAKKGQKINGVDAAKILKDARDYITRNVTAQRVAANEPAPKAGEIEAIMRQMTDKNVWEKSLLGNVAGTGISKDVTSLMHRAAYHPDVMAWMKRNAIANWDYQSIAAQAATGGTWEGRNASVTLAAARANLAALHPKASPGEINDMLRQQDIAAPIRALMGEEVNAVKRFLNSASFQAQYIARHEQQTAMRDVGLQIGLFTTQQTGVFTEELGDGRERNGFKLPVQKVVNGRTVLVEEAIYTTPEVMAALRTTQGASHPADLGGRLVEALKFIGSEAKLNKVALNPDSWMVNLLGNFMGLVQSGDLISFTPWRNVQRAIELHRSGQTKAGDALDAVREAETDQRRQMLSRLTAAGVANSGLEISDIEAGLDNRVLQFIEQSDAWDIAAGGVRGAILGNGLGRPFGIIGQGIGAAIGASAGAKIGGKKIQGAQRKIAEWTTGNPDRFAKLAAFYSNYEAHLAAGMAEQDAFNLATEKTMNTLPDYSKLPALMRELSRLGLMGSFIGFQYEVYRNTYWNAVYAKQELTSGNPALVERGMKRFVGLSGMLALAGAGLAGIIRGLFGAGVDDEKDKAYRRALGAEHERFGTLAYTKLDAEGASFFNTSYLLPQVTLFEVLKAGLEGRDLGETLRNLAAQLNDQFVDGSVHLDPLLSAWTNKTDFGAVSDEKGILNLAQRVDYMLYVTAEPGALNKLDRVVRAIKEQARNGRQFSLQEELRRFLGIRQNTYTHEERIEGRLFSFRDAYNSARNLARRKHNDRPGSADAAAALSRANEYITSLQAAFDQFQADLQTIGVPKNKFEQIRKAVKLSSEFAPLVMGEDGPESERVKSKKVYPSERAPSSAEPIRMMLPPRR